MGTISFSLTKQREWSGISGIYSPPALLPIQEDGVQLPLCVNVGNNTAFHIEFCKYNNFFSILNFQFSIHNGDAIYMVGDVSSFFTNSDYGRRYLHLVDNPVIMEGDEETAQYIDLILSSMKSNDALFGYSRVGKGGLFRTLMTLVAPKRMGFDILTCREVRLDAFLFGEQGVRYVAVLDEPREDFFLQKLVEARVNCCFLGRITKDRILIDGVDFGRSSAYSTK